LLFDFHLISAMILLRYAYFAITPADAAFAIFASITLSPLFSDATPLSRHCFLSFADYAGQITSFCLFAIIFAALARHGFSRCAMLDASSPFAALHAADFVDAATFCFVAAARCCGGDAAPSDAPAPR